MFGKQLASAILICGFVLYGAGSDGTISAGANGRDELFSFFRANSYQDYLDAHKESGYPDDKITLKPGNALYEASGNALIKEYGAYQNENGVLVWENRTGKLSFRFNLAEAGLYQIHLKYLCISKNARNVELKIKINGESPYEAASQVVLPRTFSDETEMMQDKNGNDLRPKQTPEFRWLTAPVKDYEGTNNSPLYFYFTKGENELAFESESGMLALSEIKIGNQAQAPAYKEYAKNAEPDAVKNEAVLHQSENSGYKSDSILYPTYDRSGPDVMPSDPVLLKYNTIGGANWSSDGQYIAWDIPVSRPGWYKIRLKYRQNMAIGQISYRSIKINGEIPFSEAAAVPFYFSDKWQSAVLGDGDGDWLFYLGEENNRIQMEVVPGPMGPVIKQFEDISYALNNIYQKIIMITGTQPDPNRDYLLQNQIPGLTNALELCVRNIETVSKKLTEANQGKNASQILSVLNTIQVQIKDFLDDPDSIPTRISHFRNNVSSFSDYIISAKKQPLTLDYFEIYSPDKTPSAQKAGFFARLEYGLKAFIGSFVNDYSSIGDVSADKEAITIWVSTLGRDQVQIIKDLSDNHFTPKTGIAVNINLVQQSLTAAVLSNRGPDLSLYSAESPINLAARNGVIDVSQFDTYKEVESRFAAGTMTPFTYRGGVYAVPISQSFPMMFIRTDIFRELEIKVPENWDEFYKVLAVTQKNNMNAGIGGIFTTLLYQKDSRLFREDLSATALDSPAAIEAFTQWTNMYTQYGMPLSFNFYTRFRSGEMPLAIEDYTTYNLLSSAAPEIAGLWEMYPIPGTLRKDGSLNKTVIAANTSAIMLKGAKNPENSWKFLDWFTTEEIQTEYGLDIESLLGPSGRFAVANVKAFENLPWDQKQQQIIGRQRESADFIPQIPATYYVDRNINNAFRRAVYYKDNPREALLKYNSIINAEIARKNRQLARDR